MLITTILIALGLSMDAFAVSVTRGIKEKGRGLKNALLIAFSFGFFQALMPLIGWSAGQALASRISFFDHWIAFILLALIGIKMMHESAKKDATKTHAQDLTIPLLLGLSVATSIDALAVGLSLAFLNISILIPAIVIGAVTSLVSFTGFYIGNGLGRSLKNKAELAGGLMLVAIGIKILLDHMA